MFEVFFTILFWLGVVLICAALVLLLLFLMLTFSIIRYFDKIMYDLPWMKWLTLDEIVAMGYSRVYSKMILPLLYEQGYLEVRLTGEMDEDDLWIIERLKFHPITVKFYEFRIVKRGRGRRKKRKLLRFFDSGWHPAPA
jgi:hypothetical protein